MRAAIVGFGYMGSMYAELLAAKSWTLVGVHDVDPSKFEAVTTATCYSDRKALISRPDVEVVIVATPHNEHLEVLQECLDASKHVILEKPLAASLENAKKIHALIQKHEKSSVVMVNITHCFYERIQEAKRYILENDLGTVTSISDRVVFPIKNEERSWWLFQKSVVGHGVMLTNGCHLLARILYLFSQYRPRFEFVGGIFANTNRLGDIADTAAHMRLRLVLSDGRKIPVSIFTNWPMMEQGKDEIEESMEIRTATGTLHVQAWNGVTFYPGKTPSFSRSVPYGRANVPIKEGVTNLLSLFEKEVQDPSGEMHFSVAHTYHAEETIQKLYDSVAERTHTSRTIQALSLPIRKYGLSHHNLLCQSHS